MSFAPSMNRTKARPIVVRPIDEQHGEVEKAERRMGREREADKPEPSAPMALTAVIEAPRPAALQHDHAGEGDRHQRRQRLAEKPPCPEAVPENDGDAGERATDGDQRPARDAPRG